MKMLLLFCYVGCAVRSHSGVRGLRDQHYGEPGQPGLCSVCVHHRHGNLSADAAWDPLQPRPGSVSHGTGQRFLDA